MIFLVRHGETENNRAKALQGRSDAPLNRTGELQAKTVRESFASENIRFDVVCASPLIRALQTARIIAGDCEIRTDTRLLEMDYGPYEGCRLDQLPPEVIYFFRDFVRHPSPAGMESLASVTERMGSFLRDLAGYAQGNVLLVTHAIAMKGALEYLTPDSNGAYWSKYIGNCGVYQTELVNGNYTVPTERKTA
ncbi:MAG: histidine phosphatase family protein [Oscillospiraceae bacterium]|nr:histidine phosphatase family protein [Oscillospiraceae bacterium]